MSLRTLQSKDPPESLLCSECPAEVPDWDWQLLLRAAEARNDAPAREGALALSDELDQRGLGGGRESALACF